MEQIDVTDLVKKLTEIQRIKNRGLYQYVLDKMGWENQNQFPIEDLDKLEQEIRLLYNYISIHASPETSSRQSVEFYKALYLIKLEKCRLLYKKINSLQSQSEGKNEVDNKTLINEANNSPSCSSVQHDDKSNSNDSSNK